jgi:hypothetical protein
MSDRPRKEIQIRCLGITTEFTGDESFYAGFHSGIHIGFLLGKSGSTDERYNGINS